MTIILYSDEKYESQAIECINSIKNKISVNDRIIFYTLNFKSDVKIKNVILHEYNTTTLYYKLNFYKPHLCLLTTEIYKDTHYIYIDIDFILSRKFNLDKLKHEEEYPLASYGPVEYPCIYEYIGGPVYTESFLMNYFNVQHRTMRYVWNCFFVFNDKCVDFLREWKSMCENEYLLDRKEKAFPSQDETAFNICLWKRNATKNLGHAFLNTISPNKVKFVEENKLINFSFGDCLDCNNFDWETVYDSDDIIGYHAFKNIEDMKECVSYINNTPNKNCVIIDCYINNTEKLEILKKNINSLKKLNLDIIIVSHSILPKDVIDMSEYYLYDKDNTFNQINFETYYQHSSNDYEIILTTQPSDEIKSHEYCIITSIRNSMYLAESLGYDKCIFTEFDNIYTDDHLQKMLKLLWILYKDPQKKAIFLENDNFCETIFFITNPSFIIKMLDSYFPYTIEEYNSLFTSRFPYGLEIFFSQMISSYKSELELVNQRFSSFFSDSQMLNLSRVNSIYAYIICDENDAFHLCIKSLDKIQYNVKIYENDIYVKTISIFSDILPVLKIEDIISYKKYKLMFTNNCNSEVLLNQININFDPDKLKYYKSRGSLKFK